MIPDRLPTLSTGHHAWGSGQACIMDAIAWLDGHPELGDAPDCVHPVLRAAAIKINDILPDDERHKLWALAPRLMGTAAPELDELECKRLNVRLAVFSARHVQHLVRAQDREVCEKAIAAAEAWVEDPSDAKRNAADAAAAYAAYAAAYAAHAAAAYAALRNESRAADAARLSFLEKLIEEYERLRPIQPRQITEEQWAELCEALGVVEVRA